MTTKTIQMYRTNLDGSETTLYPLTEAKYVTMDDGTTIEEALTNSDSSKYSPVIESSKAMFKVGEGDSVDLSESAIDGAYNSCVLKGKTMVNCIQEPSSQDVVLPYEFEDGQYVTINDTKESGALGVELKGQTLVNLVPKKIIDYTASSDWDGYHQLVQNSKQSFDQWRALQDLKPNTKYYISCYVETFEVVNNEGYRLNNPSVESIFGDSMIVNGVGRYQWLSTTKSELTDEIFMALRCQNAFARGAIKIRDIMIIEYQEGMEEWDIPYFEGMASCKMPILSTVGKNLFNYKNYNLKVNEGQNPQEIIVDEQGLSFNVDTASWKSLWYDLYLESGEKYTLSYNTNLLRCFIFKSKVNTYVSNELVADTTVTNATEDKIQKVTKTFTAPSTGFIRVRLVSEQKVGNHILQNFQIEKSSSVTTYEPHKSSILSLPEEVVLRSLPNGVRDTFNTRTGVYTQNIGERVINGTENWHLQEEYEDGALRFKLNVDEHKHLGASVINIRCDKMPVYSTYDSTYEKLSFCSQGLNCFQIIVPSNIALENGISNSTTFKSWLAQNYAPMTVCYQLTEPIVTKINLPSTLKSWNTTTHIYSEIPENTLYPTLSHSNPTYPVILKPSTKYSIIANSYSNDHTNSAINFNLGGATASTIVGNRVATITTPSTLTSEELVMSGRGNKLNNVMVIEGDVTGDEPYFEGICDCKSPILSNLGKNLFDYKSYGGQDINIVEIENGLRVSTWATSLPFTHNLLPNTKYTSKSVVRVVEEQVGATDIGAGKIYIYNGTTYFLLFNPGGGEYTFKTPSDIKSYNRIMFYAHGGGGSKVGVVDITNMQIEETSSATAYEPYKSNTTTFDQKDDKTIVLRSLQNGVCDTLNVETGEYVQRIGEVVFDGSSDEEMWYNSNWANGDYVACYWNVNAMGLPNKKTGAQNMVCDSFPTVTSSIVNTGGIVTREGIWGEAGSSVMYISIKKTKLTELNVTGFRQWVSQNPITVQYELETPIVSTIDVQGFPYAYKDGHVQLSSGSIEQSLTPKVEYSLVANKSGQINSNTKRVSAHQKQLDDFEAMMLTSMVQSAYDKAILQFDYEMQMMSLGGE